jgi:hypothetical protein
MMFDFFKRAGRKRANASVKEETPPAARARPGKPGQSTEFKGKVLKAKLDVIEAIRYADRQRAMDSLMIFSTLAAETIYERDLHAMFIINTAIDEINHTMDAKLKSTGEPADLTEDMDETRMYMMVRLTMLPVASMMNALQRFSNTGMDKVNSDIDSRIRQIQQFVMDHERVP